jgi:hypothetical protein
LSQPIASKSEVLWDVHVKVISQEKITRLSSVNHAIDISLSANEKEALIEFNSQEDRKRVPNRDFVLYIRDETVNRPVGLVKQGPDGDQAISLSILPDFMSARQRADLNAKF